MINAALLRSLTFALLLGCGRDLRAQLAVPSDGEGIEVTVQLEAQTGPTLSVPPPLPVPVLPQTKVRFTLHGLSANQISDASWSKNAVSLNVHGRELVIDGVSDSDTGQYMATITTVDGDVVLTSRVLHVSAFPRQRLLNLSTRAAVSADGATVIAGLVVDTGPGDAASTKLLLIRAVGPSLADFGVNDSLVDPTLRLFRSDGSAIEVAESLRDPDRIAAAASRVGAAPLRPGAADAGLLISLRGGVYTAHVGSASHHTGEVLVEIYEVPL